MRMFRRRRRTLERLGTDWVFLKRGRAVAKDESPFASTRVEPWSLAALDSVDLSFVKVKVPMALLLPLHLRLREKRLLVHSISPTRYLFPVFGLRYSAARQAIRQVGECHQVPSSPLAPALRWSRGTRPY